MELVKYRRKLEKFKMAHKTANTTLEESTSLSRDTGQDQMMEMTNKCTNAEVEERPNPSRDTDQDQFMPFGTKLVLITISLMLAVLCVALDNTVHSNPSHLM